MKRKRRSQREAQLGLFREITHLPQWESLPEKTQRILRGLLCRMLLEAAERAIAGTMPSEIGDE